MRPLVSVLITTFNRCDLLPRAIRSVLKQDFQDFELVILDDCSKDQTAEVVNQFSDSRIRYIRNEINQGAQHGDRIHLRRFVHELMRGRYFVYLCDDDYWLPTDLLSRQVRCFEIFPSLAMVIGGQADVLPRQISQKTGPAAIRYRLIPEISNTTYFAENRFPSGFISRNTFIQLFAESPTSRNLVVGAVLFKRENFLFGRVFETLDGARWQAGYELLVGAGLTGDAFYLDEPCVIMRAEWGNASYQGTQLAHLHDCIKSAEIAFKHALLSAEGSEKEFLLARKRELLHRLVFHYAVDRIAYLCGAFDNHVVGDMRHQFEPPIPDDVFWQLIDKHELPLSFWNRLAIKAPSSGKGTPALMVFLGVIFPGIWDLMRAYPEVTVLALHEEDLRSRRERLRNSNWSKYINHHLGRRSSDFFIKVTSLGCMATPKNYKRSTRLRKGEIIVLGGVGLLALIRRVMNFAVRPFVPPPDEIAINDK